MLGTENDDRTVHLAPVMFLLDGTRILIETSTASRKARNLGVRPRASVVVHTADAAWAFGSGPAAITPGAEARRLNERICAKYLTDRGQRACGDLLAELDDITIVVTPTRWLSWDMNELLANIAAHGADLDEIKHWFRPDTSGQPGRGPRRRRGHLFVTFATAQRPLGIRGCQRHGGGPPLWPPLGWGKGVGVEAGSDGQGRRRRVARRVRTRRLGTAARPAAWLRG